MEYYIVKDDQWRKRYETLTCVDDYIFELVEMCEFRCFSKGNNETRAVAVGDRVSLETEKEATLEFFAHGVRFDVYIEDEDETIDIEMRLRFAKCRVSLRETSQTYREADLAARMRRNHVQLDLLTMGKDTPPKPAKATCVIFICTFDPFGRGLPVYSFSWREDSHPDIALGDKSRRMVYNAPAWESCKDEELKSFLRYVALKQASSKLTEDLDEAVSFGKHSTSWRMGYNMIYEAIAQAKEEGLREKAIQVARNLLLMGLSTQQIAQATSLPLEEVEGLV